MIWFKHVYGSIPSSALSVSQLFAQLWAVVAVRWGQREFIMMDAAERPTLVMSECEWEAGGRQINQHPLPPISFFLFIAERHGWQPTHTHTHTCSWASINHGQWQVSGKFCLHPFSRDSDWGKIRQGWESSPHTHTHTGLSIYNLQTCAKTDTRDWLSEWEIIMW